MAKVNRILIRSFGTPDTKSAGLLVFPYLLRL